MPAQSVPTRMWAGEVIFQSNLYINLHSVVTLFMYIAASTSVYIAAPAHPAPAAYSTSVYIKKPR